MYFHELHIKSSFFAPFNIGSSSLTFFLKKIKHINYSFHNRSCKTREIFLKCFQHKLKREKCEFYYIVVAMYNSPYAPGKSHHQYMILFSLIICFVFFANLVCHFLLTNNQFTIRKTFNPLTNLSPFVQLMSMPLSVNVR